MLNIHATLVSFNDKGILFIGESGSGKSDLALRMIEEKGAKLVADDRVDVEVCNGKLIGRSPEKLKNLLEMLALQILMLWIVLKYVCALSLLKTD